MTVAVVTPGFFPYIHAVPPPPGRSVMRGGWGMSGLVIVLAMERSRTVMPVIEKPKT